MKTITFNGANWEANFRIMYEDFLTYRFTTRNKKVWKIQDRLYQNILSSQNPREEYNRITQNGKFTVVQVASGLS